MLLSGTYASMPRSSITSRLCREKKPLSALTCPGSSPHSHCTLSTIGTSNPLSFPADLLRYDQMIVAHRQRRRVAQRESPAVRQKAAVRVGTRKLPHSGLLQPLQPHGNLTKLSFELLHRRARHLQPGSFIRIFARALLLPPPNVLADLGAFRAQLFQPQRARQLHHLREDVVHRSPVA